jgi:hypothetical protein
MKFFVLGEENSGLARLQSRERALLYREKEKVNEVRKLSSQLAHPPPHFTKTLGLNTSERTSNRVFLSGFLADSRIISMMQWAAPDRI